MQPATLSFGIAKTTTSLRTYREHRNWMSQLAVLKT